MGISSPKWIIGSDRAKLNFFPIQKAGRKMGRIQLVTKYKEIFHCKLQII